MTMGQGIDMARADAPEHTAVLDNFKDQLILVLIRRLGGRVDIPISECDDTGGLLLAMSVQDAGGPAPTFHFKLEHKQ